MPAIVTLALLIALVSFYAAFTFVVIYRACRPSCRNCQLWQHCLKRQLGFQPMTAPKVRCW